MKLAVGTKVRVLKSVRLGGGHPPVAAGTIGEVRGYGRSGYLVTLPDPRAAMPGWRYPTFGTILPTSAVEKSA